MRKSEKLPTGPLSRSRGKELRGWRALALLAAAVLVFYWVPLTSGEASLQRDAVDVHYPAQEYFAERVMRGELPH